MRYIVELEEGKDIIDLCYAIKDVGKVIPTKPDPTFEEIKQEALDYIDRNIRTMPLNGCKTRLLDIASILEGGMYE